MHHDRVELQQLEILLTQELGDANRQLGNGADVERLAAAAGISVPDGGTVAGEEKCVAAALEIGLPVALKLSSPELQHKSDYGAIALDLGSEDEVRAAFGRLMASPAGPGARVLVERMVKPGLELFVAARADGVVPALVVGLGGIWTESLDDVAIVPLPADRERVEWTTDLHRLADCDLVIEAVVEDPAVKGEVFKRLSSLLAPDALIASNTSSIPIAELASWSEHRDRVLGLHFFSPAQVMKLVEVVVGIDTSDAAVERAEAFVEAIGKRPIRTKDRSGFIVNMLLVPYLMAGVRMYEEGFADREAIDEGMRLGCGHPMGPLELADFIGLDVLYAVCDSLYEEFKRPEYAPPPLLKRLVVSGHHGRKTGRGFYEYG